MELKQVDAIDSECTTDLFCIAHHSITGKYVCVLVLRRSRPFTIFRRHFRSDVKALAGILLCDLADQFIAVTCTVGPRCVEEIAREIDRQLKGLKRLLIFRSGPAAHPPEPVPDI